MIALIILSRIIRIIQFIVEMKTSTKANIYKNIVCASIGLLVLFTTSIFVAKGSLQTTINSLIDSATILKDFKYPAWGTFPGNVEASYTHALTLYNITSDNNSNPLPPILLNYSYDYSKMSFGQGNSGTIKFVNQWELEWSAGQQALKQQKVRSLNVAAQRVFNYEYYATDSRRFALNFNFTWEAMRNMLPALYAQELFQFYLHDQEVVNRAIFDRFQLDQQTREKLLNHPDFGWAKADSLVEWFKLVHMSSETRLKHPKFQMIRDAVGLSDQAMRGLTDERSTLHKLSYALNGTIKCRAEADSVRYFDCEPFCSDDQLISIQFATSMLTNSNLMGSIHFDKQFNDFNKSYLFPVEYQVFRKANHSEEFAFLDTVNSIKLFNKKIYNNFTVMSKILAYRDNLDLVATFFDLDSTNQTQRVLQAKGLIKYAEYLNTYIFNTFDQQTGTSLTDSYQLMFPNYQYLVQSMDYFKSIMESQLVAYAMLQDAKNNGLNCSDYYKAETFKNYATLCKKQQLNLNTIKGMSLFVRAYFFYAREQFINATQMSRSQAANFLRFNLKDSLFASKIKLIRKDLALLLGCSGQDYCQSEELLARQWGGDRSILNNLPLKYFPTGSISILDLDVDGKLYGQDPSLSSVLNQKITIPYETSLQLVSGEESFLVLLNLMNYKMKANKGDQLSKVLVRYTQKLVISTYFKDYFISVTAEEMLGGYHSIGVSNKQNQNPFRGGAPWLPESVSLIEMSHHPEQFSVVNTGIYDKDKLRSVIKVEEQSYSSSKYTVFQAGYQKVQEILLTDKQVFGTNLLGFHQDVQNDEQLSTYLDFIKYSVILQNTQAVCSFRGINCYKYRIKNTDKRVELGVEQQNGRYALLDSSSYILVEPITGLTLEINIIYSVYTTITSMKLLRDDLPSYKIFDNNVVYQRLNVDTIKEINDQQFQLTMLQLITICLTIFSVLMAILFSCLYLRENRKKKTEAIQSLMTGQIENSLES